MFSLCINCIECTAPVVGLVIFKWFFKILILIHYITFYTFSSSMNCILCGLWCVCGGGVRRGSVSSSLRVIVTLTLKMRWRRGECGSDDDNMIGGGGLCTDSSGDGDSLGDSGDS